MKRAFKKYTIVAGGTPQPLIGTTLGAATGPSGTDQNGDPSNVNVLVADSSMFRGGDWAVIGTTAGGDEERVFVQKVPDATHITVKGMAKAHLNGAFVRLGIQAQSVYVQTIQGNAAAIYIGTQALVKATLANVLAVLYFFAAPTQPVDWTDPTRSTPDGTETSDFWVDGTTGDGYLPSLTIN